MDSQTPTWAENDQPHRIARVNYPVRAVSFMAVFGAILLLTPERGFGSGILLFGVLSFLVYPHLTYLHAARAADSKRAELANLLIDSILLGAWAAVASFHLWFTFTVLVATLSNNAIIGGLRQFALAAACFLLGGAITMLIADTTFQPTSGLGTTLYIAVMAATYMVVISVTSHRLNDQLAKAHLSLIGNSRVFRSLLKLSAVSNDAADVADLIEKALDHFRRMTPDQPFGLLLFQRERPRQLRNCGFRGLGKSSQDAVFEHLAAHSASERRGERTKLRVSEGPMLAVPVTGQLERAHAYVLMSRELSAELGKLRALFVNQLAGTLQNKLLTEELRKAAETDELTGLFNRRYLEQQLSAAIERKLQHHGQDFSVIMMDLIGLKGVNDTQGHAAGDHLIATAAERLLTQARSTDVVARIGGDEFVVLCHDCGEANAERLAERLAAACSSSPTPGQDQASELTIKISVGVAGSDRHRPQQVLAEADRRMYEHKELHYQQHRTRR
ncbi:MAG: diguanylate cyclase [Xanthomonadales bacterium]|nr:diguanylate cyclase [Xanthomonadales bacterium]